MKDVLKADKISKVYNKKAIAVNQVSFTVKTGEIYGLIGPNGSGKTTTINMITNFSRADTGEITINGLKSSSLAARKQFGYVPDELLIPETLTGFEYLSFMMKIYEVDDDFPMKELVKIFRIEDAMQSLVGGYSHGMKKKLQFIAAILHKPKLLILDEPFRGLDPEAVIIFKKLLGHYKAKNTAILIATHDLLSAQSLCDKVGIISKAELVEEGKIKDLLRKYSMNHLEDVFMAASGLSERGIEIDKVIGNL
ncbi:ABC transporter ATP-binding protein (plasmid) [Bacillus sp. F19]|nr:ABC transporter ATP-binding protein [Bacillus sp. F19]